MSAPDGEDTSPSRDSMEEENEEATEELTTIAGHETYVAEGISKSSTPFPPMYPTTTKGTATPRMFKKTETVRLPPKFTRKVLLAFLEEEDGAEGSMIWAAHLAQDSVEMRLADGETKLIIEFSLEDYYDNNK